MIEGLDRQLILALQQNGRATNVELARHLNVHVATISKRIESLEQNEFLKVRALPNPFRLGYTAQALIGIKSDSNQIDNICSQLYRNLNVNLIVTTLGLYDILAMIYFPTWDQLLEMVSSQISSSYDVKVDIFLVKEVKKRAYWVPRDNTLPAKIDDVDKKIIEKLTEHGRYKSQHLARELGISPPACSRRISRLLKEKIIVIRALPNPAKMGHIANAFVLLRAQTNKIEKICSRLRLNKDIYIIMTLFNDYDILISLNATTPEELYALKKQVLAIDGITSSEFIIRAEIKKRYYGGFLE